MTRRICFSFLTPITAFLLNGTMNAELIDGDIVAVVDPVATPGALKVLFLGYQENNHHSPSAVFDELSPDFATAGTSLTFTNSLASISAANLANYDALMMCGNVRTGGSSTNDPYVTVIRNYVREGGALVGLHVASAAFRFDARFAALLGGRFQGHSTGQFIPETIVSNHPLVQDLSALNAFDETYILKDLNSDIKILQERVLNNRRFAWTWVRSEEEGRVFYTASGHVPGSGSTATYDSIIQPEFPDLVLRGTQWTTKRHFSSFQIGGLLSSGRVVGIGSLQTPDSGCLWINDADGPTTFASDNQILTLNGETFYFEPTLDPVAIPCPNSSESIVFTKNVRDVLDESFQGIWLTDQTEVISSLIVEGQTAPGGDPDILTETLNTEVGTGFVANGEGQLLCRATLKNTNTLALESVIYLSGVGIVVREGETHPGLSPGVIFANLLQGPLSLNSNGQFAGLASLSDGKEALVRWDGSQASLPIIEGRPVPGLTGVTWGAIHQTKMSRGGKITATVSLNGTVTGQSDTALVQIPSTGGTPVITLREGQTFSGSTVVGGLSGTNFVMTDDGTCYLTNTLTGPSVTSINDSVILRVSPSLEGVIREGQLLPAISQTAIMGNEIGSASLSLDPAGNLYFKANVVDQAIDSEGLFRVEQNTVFRILTEGAQLERGAGAFYEITSIDGLITGGSDDGLPSSSSLPETLVTSVMTTSGHRILIKLGNLNDLDRDGLPNLLEAGIGSSANDPAFNPDLFPGFREQTGDFHFTYLQPTVSGLPSPQPQKSNDLETWTPMAVPPNLWTNQSDVPLGFERVGLPVDQSGPKLFFRLAF